MEPPRQLPEQDATRAAAFLRSLASAHRLQILCHLAGREMNVGELHQHFDLSASAFSQHLAVLRQQQLVQCRKEAQTVFYSIKDEDTLRFIELLKSKFCPDLT